ncbi:MAG: M28 family peptidase [Pyrinomonadaceae bacterium]|nr:M28 family peptidase [Pyrinomonadaceae bacterium]
MPTQPTHATLSPLRSRSASRLFLAALFCALSLFIAACKEQPAQNQNAGAQPTPAPTPGVPFDGQRAFEHVRKQVEFGPRPAGSAELAKARDYITGELRSYGLNYSTDAFQPQTPVGVRQMVNITAELPGESSEVIIISTHYDTKLFKEFTFVGANDGGSSTGAVLELARVLKARGQKPRYTYWFVFFDGEEAFCKEWDECKNPNGEPDNTYGSRRYVQQLKEKNETKRVRAMILLDMVGNKNLEFGRDMELSSQWLVNLIWDTAYGLGFNKQFVNRSESVGSDDHEPFLRAGIDAVDIIQIQNNPHWHEPTDTLDTISPASLKIVGDVALASLPRIEERLQSRSR